MSNINCESLAQFVEVCAELVKAGIVFQAYAGSLTIHLTGGY